MNLPRLLLFFAVTLFAIIGLAAYSKKNSAAKLQDDLLADAYLEAVELSDPRNTENANPNHVVRKTSPTADVDHVEELFRIVDPKLPIVETITYKSRVPWLSGREAWVSHYASHFDTSRHFIARSLNGGPDYTKQQVRNGDRFNVLRTDIDLSFHMVIDISRAKLWLYYHNETEDERQLIKTYSVGLGRPDEHKASGLLTPLGTYELGDTIAIYEPGRMGNYRGETIEMVQVFGTRWIPFAKEIADCTEPARGFGIHGSPWHKDNETGQLIEERSSIGGYESDGCIRLATEDIEEIFSIVITRPTFVHLVKDVSLAELPGHEVLR